MLARLTRVESEMLYDHSALTKADECYFMYEYTSGRDYKFSSTNSLIANLKRGPEFKNRPNVWKHKQKAIKGCADAISTLINPKFLETATLIPIPPSKAKNDPLYDGRMRDILDKIDCGVKLDIRELVFQVSSMESSHLSVNRSSLEDLIANYKINEDISHPPPQKIAIFDDVLTVGTHFRAITTVLRNRFPEVPLYGFFIARRVFPIDDFDDFDVVSNF